MPLRRLRIFRAQLTAWAVLSRPRTRGRFRGWRILWPLFLCGPAFAADESAILHPGGTPRSTAPAVATANSGSTSAAAVALLLVGGGGWALWRARRNPRLTREQRLGIRETRPLGGRQYLVVAAYDDQKFLIGVSPAGITLIAALDSADDREDTA